MALLIFREMKSRKRFFGGDQGEAIEVHKRLPEHLKLHFMVCTDADEPIAALGWVTFGSTGLPLVSATGSKALERDAAYVLWWKMIEYYKTHGFCALDTGGVSQQRNPGGYYFKTHILGKGFKEPHRTLGQFDACRNPLSEGLFNSIHSIRDSYREVGRRLARRNTEAASRRRQGPA
jgi:lipid II:glycine glycyltransferase (peptidoglycan interpeptide bridge formation enzyme)